MVTIVWIAGMTILEGNVIPALRIQGAIITITMEGIFDITTTIGDICTTDTTIDTTGICIPGLTIEGITICTPCATIGITDIEKIGKRLLFCYQSV
jgi:hypothetical protein